VNENLLPQAAALSGEIEIRTRKASVCVLYNPCASWPGSYEGFVVKDQIGAVATFSSGDDFLGVHWEPALFDERLV
jgi:hypothetical protein